MSNEPVDAGVEMRARMNLKNSKPNKPQPRILFRIRPHEVTFYQRMADYFWRQGLIKEPSLHLLGRACLNIVANKWARLEEQNYNAYLLRRFQR
ncbi:MAG: hypothetical protein M3Y53_02175 [Thermoproteota archaeon]|nr:hypothetical protein [Thermoproteota archaeon]